MECTQGMQRQRLLTGLCVIPKAIGWDHYHLSCGVSGRSIAPSHKLKQLHLQQRCTSKGDMSNV